jgi:DNA-binding NtrC family response regulator
VKHPEVLFGRYEVQGVLGRGGVGTVYRVADRMDRGAPKALKVVDLPPGDLRSYDLIRSEFEILSRTPHPHIAEVFEIGRKGDRAYFTMEYVTGADFMEATKRLDQGDILLIGVQVLRALAFVHGLGYVHGDIKPQNIIVDESGGRPMARLLDFGLAESVLKEEVSGLESAGTPAYFPPEKGLGTPADPRSDLYSFGVTLFQALTGCLPFGGKSTLELIEMHRTVKAPAPSSLDPSIPVEVDRVCLRLLEKEPRKRFQSAETVLADLAPFVPGLGDEEIRGEGRHLFSAAFIGRDDSVALLDRKMKAVLEGASLPVWVQIAGPQGIGKTRLASEFALSARIRGIRVLEATCRANPIHPLEPLSDLLQHFPDPCSRLEEPGKRWVTRLVKENLAPPNMGCMNELLSGLEELLTLAARDEPVLFLLEDLHRAEPELLHVLDRLTASDEPASWAIFGMGRDKFIDPRSAEIMKDLLDRKVGTVRPRSFDGSDVAAWISTALPGASMASSTARTIADWAGGNPFLIERALRTGLEEGRFVSSGGRWRFEEPGPGEKYPFAEVHSERRLEQLSKTENETLEGLALVGSPADVELLSAALGREFHGGLFSALRDLARRGWVIEDERAVEFGLSSEGLRRNLLVRMDRTLRSEGHRRLARTLGEKAEVEPQLASRVAEHWARSGVEEETAPWCLRAAQSAYQRRMPRRAIRFLRAGARAAESKGGRGELLGDIRFLLSECYRQTGKTRRAESLLRVLCESDLPPLKLANCRFCLGLALGKQGRLTEALSSFESSGKILEEIGNVEFSIEVLSSMATSHIELGNFEKVLDLIEELEKRAKGFPGKREENLYVAAYALVSLGRLDEALARAAESLRYGRKSDKKNHLVPQSSVLIGYIRHCQGELDKARKWYAVADKMYRDGKSAFGRAIVADKDGGIAFRQGKPGEAHERFGFARETFRRAGNERAALISTRAHFGVLLACGRFREVERTVANLEREISPAGDDRPTDNMLAAIGRMSLSLCAKSPRKALSRLDSFRSSRGREDAFAGGASLLLEADVLLENRRFEEALTRVVEHESSPLCLPLTRPSLLARKGRALAGLGRFSEALEVFEAARTEARKSGQLGVLTEILLAESRSLVWAEEVREAARLARTGLQWARKTGRPGLVWELHLCVGSALEKAGRLRGAKRHFRRALWEMEAVFEALPEPYRPGFLAAPEVKGLLGRVPALRAEETAQRAARIRTRSLNAPEEGWVEALAAWASVSLPLLGADGGRFEARWEGAAPGGTVLGEASESDSTLESLFGQEGKRPISVTLFRRFDRGPFPPAAIRLSESLFGRLSTLLERQERGGLERRFGRLERRLAEYEMQAETVLAAAKETLIRTRTSLDLAKGFGEIIGRTKPIIRVFDHIRRWGPTEATVVVRGESGTGKELIANAIHTASERQEGPLFAVNCAAMTESLLESELFGYEQGAFTGAEESRAGLLELSNGGTLILDEVEGMSPKMQRQLLRVLEEKSVRRIGGTEELPLDIRFVALTSRRLDKEVEASRFRRDLFHRLNMAEIEVPPLRKRKADIPLLAEYFLGSVRGPDGDRKLSRAVAARLLAHRWPGNVRELRNAVFRAAVFAKDRPLRVKDFPDIGRGPLTKTSLTAGKMKKLRSAAARKGISLERRHEELLTLIGATGRIRRSEYEEVASVSKSTATRDLKLLMGLGLIKQEGKGRGSVYRLG